MTHTQHTGALLYDYLAIIFTFPSSFRLVIMTTVLIHFSHTIRQKSPIVVSMGPWHAM